MSSRGAEFRKADLQIHSPRDAGWDGARPEDSIPKGVTSTPQTIFTARETYCKNFIKKCFEEGLRAIAITDHHEGVYAYLMIEAKEKLAAEGNPIDLWIFPGMEMTCKDSCQALIIFDANLPQVVFEKARGKLGLPADCSVNRPVGIKVELLDYNLEDLQSLLEADNELRDRFIILPHVKPNGHKTVLRTGFHKRFKEMRYVGGYMDQCYPHQLNEGDQRILDGEIPAWSSEKRGVISTSDARHSDFRLIGKHASWIKLASPTAESIRQAMLAPDSRIRHADPKLPSVVITKLVISGAEYVENGEYFFNQQMNSIIGGRGAGKSSLLEYIRFALGCSALDGKDAIDDNTKATARMRDMLQSTLSLPNGKIVIDVLLNGAPVSISRSIAAQKFISVKNGEEVTDSTVDEITRLIPVQSFRQGELSDLARDELADRLLELVTANASEVLEELEASLRKNGQQLSEVLAKAVRLSASKHRERQLETQVSLIRAQIESLQKQLEIASPQKTSVIADHDRFVDEDRNLGELNDAIKRSRQGMANLFALLIDSINRLTEARPKIDLPELTEMYSAIRCYLSPDDGGNPVENLSASKSNLFATFDSLLASLAKFDETWKVRLKEHNEAYTTQRNALIGQQGIIAKLEELNLQLNKALIDLEAAKIDEQEFRTADVDLQAHRIERRNLYKKLVDTTKSQIDTVAKNSSGLAFGELSAKWDCTEVESAARNVLELPLLREKRIDDLLAKTLSGDSPLDSWDDLIDEMLTIVKWKEGASVEGYQAPETPLMLASLGPGFLDKLYATISSDRVAIALRAVLRPKVNIFQKRDGKDIEFKKASQGEQAATLLNILMNQSRGPLIIDQPEEDLDNRIINDIIKTIRLTKDDRQLILSTHNANIAVNGDSELVIEMSQGKKNSSGAIDESEIRTAITLTMEGGKDAFELRRKKYNY